MKKTLVSLLLVAALLLTAVASLAEVEGFNAEGLPIVNEKVTLTTLVATNADTPADVNDLTIFKEAEEQTNVHIEWTTAAQGDPYSQKLSLMLATEDLPDFFWADVPAADIAKYGAEGTFVPMEDLIAQYAPLINSKLTERPDMKAFVTAPDGHMYGIPKVSEGPWSAVDQIYGINVAWLDKLGLSMPTNLAEFENVLIAFRDGDPNGNGEADEVPFSFSDFKISKFEYVFSAMGLTVSGKLFDVDDDNKVYCVATDERFRKGIELISKWYAEGLIDPEAFVMDFSQWMGKLNAETTVMGVAPQWDISDNITTPELRADYDYMDPLFGEDGSAPTMNCPFDYGYFRGVGIITKVCTMPEVVCRYLDYWYEPLNSYQSMEGHVGERLFYQEDGSLQVGAGDDAQLLGGLEIQRGMSCLCYYGIWYVDAQQYSTELRLPSTDLKVAHINEKLLPYADQSYLPSLFYTPEESEAIAINLTDVKNYINRMSAEWIINNSLDDAAWDAFQAELVNMGVENCVAIQQAAYDRTL